MFGATRRVGRSAIPTGVRAAATATPAMAAAPRAFGGLDAGEPYTWDHSTHWKDMLQLQGQLTEDERDMVDMAHRFCQEQLLPGVAEHFRNEDGDTKGLMKAMGEVGLLGSQMPPEFGGCAASHVTYGLLAREVERVDSGYRSAMSVQSSLVMLPIYLFGQEALKQRLLPQLATADLVGCFGLTEPNQGSDPAGMLTHAKQDANGDYVVSGAKNWITNSPIADVFVVWAVDKTDDRVRGFVLERGMQGLSAPKIDGKFALRASPTGMIHMDQVRVPRQNVLQVSGMKGPFTCLNSARLGIAWGALGAAQDCLDRTVAYTMERHQFQRPLAANQLIQFKIANALQEINIGLQGVFRATQLKDEGRLHSNVISMLKRNSCTKSLAIARDCRDMLGGNGIVDEYGVVRHMMNLEAVNTYEGTQDIHALVMGRAVTGIPAFRAA